MYNNNKYLRRRSAAVYESLAADAETDNVAEKCPAPDQTYAMAYVNYQVYGDVYTDAEALKRGTLFPPLDLPYEGGRRI